MSPPSATRPACVAVLLAGLALLAPAPAAGETPACLECHNKEAIGTGDRSVHPPFRASDCGACHGAHADPKSLTRGNEACHACHAGREGDFLRSHAGAQGDRVACVSCHDPHRSTEPRLLLPLRHRPLAFGVCNGCHGHDGRLTRPVPQLCLGCHGGKEFSRAVTHGPLRRGECLVCHDPHAAREEALLRRRFAPGRTITGERDVALCFGCHTPRSFFTAEAGGTSFRDGERNLHQLHVDGDSGGRLSCRNCHEVHTADWPRLVRRELDCDGVPCLRLDFRRGIAGGQCLSGCHASQGYVFGKEAQATAGRPLPPPSLAAAPRRRPGPTTPERTDLRQSIDQRCIGCHQKDVRGFAAGSRVHAPVRAGTCTACHLDHGPENRLVLLGSVDRVCATCHPLDGPELAAQHRGYRLEGADCTECHDPHGGDGRGLLLPERHAPFAEGDCAACHGPPSAGWRVEGGGEVCAACHDDLAGGPHPHPALAKQGCRGCHRPHAGSEPKLLRASGAALCFICHDRTSFTGATVHAPVAEGDCAACHPAHGSTEPHLVGKAYPLERFVDYRDEAYALCWGCHDPSLVDPGTAGGGGFSREGRNLHAVHVRDRVSTNELGRRVQPGISCRNCHDPHATADQRLVRRTLDCDGVPCLQLDFRKAGQAGRCAGGCHDLENYGEE